VLFHAVLCCAVQASEQRMRDMMDRLETTENRQNTIVSFLARLAQNPTVLQQMVSVAQNVGLQRSLNDGRNGGESLEHHPAGRQREAVWPGCWPRQASAAWAWHKGQSITRQQVWQCHPRQRGSSKQLTLCTCTPPDWAHLLVSLSYVCRLAAGRKKRRGRNGEEVDASAPAGVPLEQNHAQIIQYMPSGGDYALLHHLTGMMPQGDIPPDVAAAFDGLHLSGQQVRAAALQKKQLTAVLAVCICILSARPAAVAPDLCLDTSAASLAGADPWPGLVLFASAVLCCRRRRQLAPQ
jgi:hypothetical protein